MKAIDKKIRQNGLRTKRYLSYSIIFFVLFGFSSCTEDYWIIESPQPSNAYIALTWSEDEPDYIDAGTGAIPEIFYWNDYYRIYPGSYTLYYDGIFNNGYEYIDYAWEVDYEIYTNNGTYNDDNYFSIDLNPYGPYVDQDYKSASLNSTFKVLETSDSKIVILKQGEEYSLKVTYRKVERQNQQ